VRHGLYADDYLAPLLSRLDRPVVFELGAHCGEDTRRLAGYLRPPYRYFAWEPDPRSLDALREAVRGLPQVTVVAAAAGAADGIAPFHLSSRADGGTFTDASSLLRPTEKMRDVAPWLAFDEQVTVPVRTLDAFCAEHHVSRIDFIWADVQGGERHVVAGATRMLAQTAFLFLEQSGETLYDGQWTFDEMTRVLGRDWAMVKQFPNDVLLYNRRLVDAPRDADWTRFLRGCCRDLR